MKVRQPRSFLFWTTITLISIFTLDAQELNSQGAKGDATFLLDLGIAIEPKTGKEVFNRAVKSPSKDVDVYLKKESSGSVYMASTKELIETLKRINDQVTMLQSSFVALEKTVHTDMAELKDENSRFRDMVSDLMARQPVAPAELLALSKQMNTFEEIALGSGKEEKKITASSPNPIHQIPSVPVATDKNLEPSETSVVNVEQKQNAETTSPNNGTKKFNEFTYMSAVFAYQREDYKEALHQFQKLSLINVNERTAGNTLYWMADCQYVVGLYIDALGTLEKIKSLKRTDKRDDALILTGLIFRAMGGKEPQAIAAFQDVIKLYPESEYSTLAQLEMKKTSTPDR